MEKNQAIAEQRAFEIEQKKEQARLKKARKDEIARVENEKRVARKLKDDAWKAEQLAHLCVLVQLAGNEAERNEVSSIHRGR
jgi:hypothetical protein